MARQTFTASQVLTAAQMNTLQANDYNQTVSTKTASYTLVAADAGTKVVMNSASATTITVNTSLFAAGDTLTLLNIGAGVCTITAGTATVSTTGSLALAQYGGGTLYFSSAGVSVFQANGVAAIGGGLIPITPTSVAVGSGTGTANAVGQVTYSGASSVSLNGVFTSSYRNYKMVLEHTCSTATDLKLRLRAAGTDNTTANSYVAQLAVSTNAAVSGSDSTNNLLTLNNNITTTLINFASNEFFNPQIAAATGIFTFAMNDTNGGYFSMQGATHNQTVSYDGFTIFPTLGTITGTMSVYGYNQ